MVLVDISFTPYVPTTILGLIGLIAGYLFLFLKNRDDNKLKEIQSTDPKDRVEVMAMSLNELGVKINTDNLTSAEKLDLIKSMLRTKTKKYLIISITSIGLALMISVVIRGKGSDPSNDKSSKPNTSLADSLNDEIPFFDSKSTVADTMAAIVNQSYSEFKWLKGKRLSDELGNTRYESKLTVYGIPAIIEGNGDKWSFVLSKFNIKDSIYAFKLGNNLGQALATVMADQLQLSETPYGNYYDYSSDDHLMKVDQEWSIRAKNGSVYLKIGPK